MKDTANKAKERERRLRRARKIPEEFFEDNYVAACHSALKYLAEKKEEKDEETKALSVTK